VAGFFSVPGNFRRAKAGKKKSAQKGLMEIGLLAILHALELIVQQGFCCCLIE